MNTIYVLTVCLGVLWGGMCETTHQFTYPTMEACQFEMKRVNTRNIDGYAYCTAVEKKK
jgi:hypothetical protein